MNLLFAYPVFLPTSSGGGDVPIEILWAILIVCNGIGIVAYLLALLVNKYENKKNKYSKESLFETIDDSLLFSFGIGLAIIIDIITAFCSLVFWVATLL